jgi:hypothetical protein
MKLIALLALLISCSKLQQIPKGDLNDPVTGSKSSQVLYNEKAINVLFMIGPEISQKYERASINQNMHLFYWKLKKDFILNFITSGLNRPKKFSFIEGSQFDAKDYEEPKGQNIPGIYHSILNLKYLSQSEKIDKSADTYVIILSSRDDSDFYFSMDGKIKEDHLEKRIASLKTLNQIQELDDRTTRQYFDFKKMRFITIVPKSTPCTSNRKNNFRYRYASKEIAENYWGKNDKNLWPDNFDLCSMDLGSILEEIYQRIREDKATQSL